MGLLSKQKDDKIDTAALADSANADKLPATTSSTNLTVPSAADEFDGAPTGLENVGVKDLIIPRLTILQALSPQINKRKAEFIDGAEQGDICDTATNDIFRGSMLFLPCYYATVYLEWAPRDSGKGLIANHGMDASVMSKTALDDRKRNVLPNGNYIAEMATYFGLNLSAGARRSFLPLTSTQLKAARKWMTLITNQRVKRADGSEFQPPIFFRSWKASVVEQENSQGSWFGWKFDPDMPVLEIDPKKELLAEAKAFYAEARDGLVKGDFASMAEEGASGDGDSNENKPM